MKHGMHHGQPLTPKSFARLWSDLFCGLGLQHVRVIESAVVAEHLASAGLPPTMDVGALRKKALKHLHNFRGTHGYWAVGPYVDVAGRGASMTRFTLASLEDLQALCADAPRGRYEPPETIAEHPVYGQGTECVYLYYWPSQRHSWEAGKKQNSWPCKIGKSSVDVRERILDQTGTSRNELPVIAWEYRSDDAGALERALLDLLPHVPDQPTSRTGREWRLTNPRMGLLLARALAAGLADEELPGTSVVSVSSD